MEKLKSLAKTVKDVLEEDTRTRNSDSFLYLKVLEEYGNRKGLDINGMSVTTFLMRMTEYGFPPFESVRRNRQLVQAKHPELAPSDPIDAYRAVNEERVRDYVRQARYD